MINTISRKVDITPAEYLGNAHKAMMERCLKKELLLSLLDSGQCDNILLLNFTTNITASSLEVIIDYEQNNQAE